MTPAERAFILSAIPEGAPPRLRTVLLQLIQGEGS